MERINVSQVAKAFKLGEKQAGVSVYLGKIVSASGDECVVKIGSGQTNAIAFQAFQADDIAFVLLTEAGAAYAIAKKETTA